MKAPIDIARLVDRINAAAPGYRVGSLQQLRRKLGKNPRTGKIFTRTTTKIEDEYAYHDGGRTELQFNVGVDEYDGVRFLRYGVAFEFKDDQTLPDPSILLPNVRLFNIWVKSNEDALRGFRMWIGKGRFGAKIALRGRF